MEFPKVIRLCCEFNNNNIYQDFDDFMLKYLNQTLIYQQYKDQNPISLWKKYLEKKLQK